MVQVGTKNPLVYLHKAEKPYEVEWEALEPPTRPARPSPAETEPLVALWRAEEDAEF